MGGAARESSVYSISRSLLAKARGGKVGNLRAGLRGPSWAKERQDLSSLPQRVGRQRREELFPLGGSCNQPKRFCPPSCREQYRVARVYTQMRLAFLPEGTAAASSGEAKADRSALLEASALDVSMLYRLMSCDSSAIVELAGGAWPAGGENRGRRPPPTEDNCVSVMLVASCLPQQAARTSPAYCSIRSAQRKCQ